MKMYKQKFNRGKGSVNNIPNAIAYTFIRNYMNSKEFEEIAHSMFIKKMNLQKKIRQKFTQSGQLLQEACLSRLCF